MATAEVVTQQPLLFDGPVHIRPIINHKPRSSSVAVKFDQSIHLAYTNAAKVLSMEDVGYPKETGISPVAISEAFPLFTPAAIELMRAEILKDEVWNNCLYLAGNSSAYLIRGHCPRYTPFMYEALTHPATLKIISDIAGIDLVPVMDYEIGTVLISSTPESVMKNRLAYGKTDGAAGKVTNWHRDHYPFVCVVMLSDASGMVGGETAIQTSSGDIKKVRGPEMGSATVMQGRYISHQALAAEGGKERISMVTSFRPRSPHVLDDSSLKYITRIADTSELYYQYSSYRLQILEDRIREARKQLDANHEAAKRTDVSKLKDFLQDQISHLAVTSENIVHESKVLSGRIYDGAKIRGTI